MARDTGSKPEEDVVINLKRGTVSILGPYDAAEAPIIDVLETIKRDAPEAFDKWLLGNVEEVWKYRELCR